MALFVLYQQLLCITQIIFRKLYSFIHIKPYKWYQELSVSTQDSIPNYKLNFLLSVTIKSDKKCNYLPISTMTVQKWHMEDTM